MIASAVARRRAPVREGRVLHRPDSALRQRVRPRSVAARRRLQLADGCALVVGCQDHDVDVPEDGRQVGLPSQELHLVLKSALSCERGQVVPQVAISDDDNSHGGMTRHDGDTLDSEVDPLDRNEASDLRRSAGRHADLARKARRR